MIRGQVLPNNDAVIQLGVRGPGGSRQVNAVVDTGFSGFLSLAPAIIASLGLPFRQTVTFTLADYTDVQLDVYLCDAMWDGRIRPAFVVAAEGDALVGMSLLSGYRLMIDALDGGEVTIELLPS